MLISSWGDYENQVIPLGLIILNLFLIGSGRQKVDVQNGTERVEVEISYIEKETSPLEKWEVWIVRRENNSEISVPRYLALSFDFAIPLHPIEPEAQDGGR